MRTMGRAAAVGLAWRRVTTLNDLLTPSMSSAGTADVAVDAAGLATGVVLFSWLVRVAVTSVLQGRGGWGGGSEMQIEPRASSDASSGGLAARDVGPVPARWGQGRASKKPGA